MKLFQNREIYNYYNFILVHHESKVAAEKKILTLISQVTERDEATRQLKEERPTTNEVLALISQRDEEIRLLKEELHKRTKGNV